VQYRFSATLEFDLAPPVTTRGDISASAARTAFARAADALLETHPNRKWRSAVVVIEKLDPVEVDEPAETDG
jgi:hypothetical protein